MTTITPTERKRLQAELRHLEVLQGLHNERINQIREALGSEPVSKGLSEKDRLALITSRRKRAYAGTTKHATS
jgi:hypothetical protein